MAVPTSTYRFHLTHESTLHDAAGMVDHLDRLGIDWAYASPIQTVPPGATHGYHITDPDQINPELGGHEGLAALHRELATRGRGLLLDIVPNHLAASPANTWWADLLRHGPDSPYASFFDVDLGTREQPRPIVLPVLGVPLDEAIADGAVRVEHGELVVHDDLRLPLAEGTDPAAPIEQVLAGQHYRLHLWHEGERVLNWRRFFAVNDLVAVNVQDPTVFDATHRLVAGLLADGVLTGLRVDHIDGLLDPGGYLQRLRDLAGPDVYLLVEKILDRDEHLPKDWPVHGTTGYEVANAIAQWLVDHGGHHRLVEVFESRTGIHGPVGDALPQSKLHVLHALFEAEVAAVSRLLGDVDGVHDDEVAQVIRLIAAHLHGYRTYVPPTGAISPADERRLDQAVQAASVTAGRAAEPVGAALTGEAGRPALLRLQQLTGPAAAKGFEDRLLYQHVALSSLCEVGADAATLDAPWQPAEAAAALVARAGEAPDGGTTTSTHDTKRGEDVRAVIHVLAEVPEAFTDLLAQLDAHTDASAGTDPHARWLLLQQAVALLALDRQPVADLLPRLQGYAGKALREAEVVTSHTDPDEAYEAAVDDWLGWLLDGDRLAALRRLADEIRLSGLSNALAALVLKVVAPGVPDVYRGTEVWDDSLVDPDNRRPLDHAALARALQRAESTTGTGQAWWEGAAFADRVAELRDSWQDGAVKLHVTRTALHLRRSAPSLFARGTASAPTALGSRAEHVAALRREDPSGTVVAVATRLPHRLAGPNWPVGAVWEDTTLPLPGAPPQVRDVLTGRSLQVDDGHLPLTDALAVLPVAMVVWS
jgi:malto-oligosyltrehalose synthase